MGLVKVELQDNECEFDIVGCKVEHLSYGLGIVIKYESNKIMVKFDDKVKLFPYPNDFTHLRIIEENVNCLSQKKIIDINKAMIVTGKQLKKLVEQKEKEDAISNGKTILITLVDYSHSYKDDTADIEDIMHSFRFNICNLTEKHVRVNLQEFLLENLEEFSCGDTVLIGEEKYGWDEEVKIELKANTAITFNILTESTHILCLEDGISLTVLDETNRILYSYVFEPRYYFVNGKDHSTSLDRLQDPAIEDNFEHNISFENFIVKTNTLACKYREHSLETVNARIHIILPSGEIGVQDITAGFCGHCNICFISPQEYTKIRAKGILICQQISETVYYEGNYSQTWDLKNESLLKQCGYNVNASEGLSDKQRQQVLARIVDYDLLDINSICSHLNWLVSGRSGNSKYSNAIRKWQEDIEFISDYKKGSRRIVGVKSILNRDYVEK